MMVQGDIGKTITVVVIFLFVAFTALSITNQFSITDISLKSALFFLVLGIAMALIVNLVFGRNLDSLVAVVSVITLIGIGFLFYSVPSLIPINFAVAGSPISDALTGNNFKSFPYLGIALALIVFYALSKSFREQVKIIWRKLW